MSMELHVLLEKSRLPDVQAWQAAIDALGFDVKLDPSLAVETDTGFLPAKFNGNDSGFEFDVSPVHEIADTYPEFGNEFAGRDVSGNFRWGGDLNEMACALVASAALATLTDGTWFDPQEGACVDPAGAVEEARGCRGRRVASWLAGSRALLDVHRKRAQRLIPSALPTFAA